MSIYSLIKITKALNVCIINLNYLKVIKINNWERILEIHARANDKWLPPIMETNN